MSIVHTVVNLEILVVQGSKSPERKVLWGWGSAKKIFKEWISQVSNVELLPALCLVPSAPPMALGLVLWTSNRRWM